MAMKEGGGGGGGGGRRRRDAKFLIVVFDSCLDTNGLPVTKQLWYCFYMSLYIRNESSTNSTQTRHRAVSWVDGGLSTDKANEKLARQTTTLWDHAATTVHVDLWCSWTVAERMKTHRQEFIDRPLPTRIPP